MRADRRAAHDYGTAGKHVGTVTAKLHDRSALCDNILGNVLTSDNRISLTVTTSPAGNVFRPGDPQTGIVNLHVRVKNTSDPSVARGVVLFKGANVLSCDTEIRVGSSTLRSRPRSTCSIARRRSTRPVRTT